MINSRSRFLSGLSVRRWIQAATVVLAAILCFWHSQELGQGVLSEFDEFYTFERSIGFFVHNDWWSVYSVNEPTLKKPPLQYWMSAGLMKAGVSDILALRLPSAIFTFGAFLVTALIAHEVLPRRPWVMPFSILLLSTSRHIWDSATSAMLDAGAMFFTSLGILFILKAFETPKYWGYFALSAFLAGLQKGPTPLAFLAFAAIAILLARSYTRPHPREALSSKPFKVAVLASIPLSFIWPIFQKIRYAGTDALGGSVEGEMLARFAPTLDEKSSPGSFETFLSLMFKSWDETELRLLGFVALLTLPFILKRPVLIALSGMIIGFVAIMWFASGSVYGRYVLIVMPLLSVGAACAFFAFRENPVWGIVAASLFVIYLGGPFKTDLFEAHRKAAASEPPWAEILSPVASNRSKDEQLLVCAANRDTRIPRGAVTVFASAGLPFLYDRKGDILRFDKKTDLHGVPLRGICTPREMEAYAPYLDIDSTEPLVAPYFQWTGRLKDS